jgi:hypothetical protein
MVHVTNCSTLPLYLRPATIAKEMMAPGRTMRVRPEKRVRSSRARWRNTSSMQRHCTTSWCTSRSLRDTRSRMRGPSTRGLRYKSVRIAVPFGVGKFQLCQVTTGSMAKERHNSTIVLVPATRRARTAPLPGIVLVSVLVALRC